MKYVRTILAVLVLCVSGTLNGMAQRPIDKLIDEIEQKGVDVNTLVKRNEQKQVYFTSKKLVFISKDGKYANKLMTAFKESEDQATTINRNKRGTTQYYTLTFNQGEKKMIYRLSVTAANRVSLSYTLRDGNVKPSKDEEGFFDSFGEMFEGLGDAFSEAGDSIKVFFSNKQWNDSTFRFRFSDKDRRELRKSMDELKKHDWNKDFDRLKKYDWDGLRNRLEGFSDGDLKKIGQFNGKAKGVLII